MEDINSHIHGDDRFLFRERFPSSNEAFHHVSISVKDDRKTTLFDYTPRGMKIFFPWKLLDFNTASHEGLAGSILSMLPEWDQLIRSHQYPFFRADVNIFMSFLRVCLF